jgi:hypothetical protein
VEPASLPAPPPPTRVVRLQPSAEQGANEEEEPASVPADLPLGTRIGQLTHRQCLAELNRAGVAYRREPEADDVRTPIRLLGPVGDVTYRGQARQRPPFPSDVLDCRLAVALIELSTILREHDIVEVTHISLHRESAGGNPVDTGGSTGHRGGLAIDVALVQRRDGSTLNVLGDWKGHRGAPVCGPRAASGATSAARTLREVVCRADRLRLFHVLLTPNHDHAHRNHFHMEVRPDGVSWVYLR